MSDKQLAKIADRLDDAANQLEASELVNEIDALHTELREIPYPSLHLRGAANNVGFILGRLRGPTPADIPSGLRSVARALRR